MSYYDLAFPNGCIDFLNLNIFFNLKVGIHQSL